MECRTSTVRQSWAIETYPCDLNQVCGVERCAVRSARALRTHIGCAIRTYLRLIWHELHTSHTRFATTLAAIRPAVQPFLPDPRAVLRGFPLAGMAHNRAAAYVLS